MMKNLKFCLKASILSLLFFCSCSKEIKEEKPEPPSTEEIQERLNNGESPYEIYHSVNQINQEYSNILSIHSFIGMQYEGGIISVINTDLSGIIVSEEDIGLFPWGCYGVDISFEYESNNSDSLLTLDCMIGSAVEACKNYVHEGFDDWYLPSVFTIDYELRIFPNASGLYWSSTWGSYTIKDDQAYEVAVGLPEHCTTGGETTYELGIPGTSIGSCSHLVNRSELRLVRAVRNF